MSVQGFTVYDMIARGAALHGAAPAVIQAEHTLSFREFKARVDALAAGLATLGIGAGDRIAILAQNATAYFVLYGACARQGILAYPINWRLTAEEVARVLERASPKMMVADASTLAVVAGWPESKRQVPHWYQFGSSAAAGFKPFDSLFASSGDVAPAAVSPDHPFAAISTAAVDVVPRGAVLTHGNVIAANLTAMAAMGISAADRYLLALPLFHITALGLSLAHMRAGGGASHRPSRHHSRLGLSPGAPEPAGCRSQAGQPPREPAPRVGAGRAADHRAAPRGDGRPVLDGLRPVGDERVREHPAREGAPGGGGPSRAPEPGGHRG